MKWECNPMRIGDKRIKSRFLFFPKNIYGECRWLEIATWEEIWETGAGTMGAFCHWAPTRWILRG